VVRQNTSHQNALWVKDMIIRVTGGHLESLHMKCLSGIHLFLMFIHLVCIKILEEEVYFPDELEDTDQGEFINNLLQVQRAKRIGKGQFGAKEVKEQAWLKDINWDDASSKRLKPPFIPVITATDDTSNFDDFDETWEPEKKVNQIDLNKFLTWPTESYEKLIEVQNI